MTKRILIADDNAGIVDILRNYLRKEGYQTLIAENGRVALERFRDYKPDLVLLDVMMPEMDGFQVCREIRKEFMVQVHLQVTAPTRLRSSVPGAIKRPQLGGGMLTPRSGSLSRKPCLRMRECRVDC